MFKKKLLFVSLLLVCSAGIFFAQNITFFNRFGSTFLSKETEQDASPNFGNIYNWVVGGYESEKFSLYGRAQFVLESTDGWTDDVTFGIGTNNPKTGTKFMEFNGAIRPLPFLEIALGNGYGTNDRMELPWEGYQLPGGYGYATEASYGLRKWASGNGLTFLLKGEHFGMEGLSIGWNALPLGNIVQDGNAAWENTSMISYQIKDLAHLSLGGKFTTEHGAGHVIGFYGELLAVKGLKVNAGITMSTASTTTMLGANDVLSVHEKDFTTLVNTGVQYTITPLRMTLGADMGILAGKKQLTGQYTRHDATAMPLLVGGIIRWTIIPPVHARIQIRYGDTLASKEAARDSVLVLNPRISYNTGATGTFCLDPVIEIGEVGRENIVGYRLGLYWQYNFGKTSSGRPRS